MELEELRYKSLLRKIERKEQEKEAQERVEREEQAKQAREQVERGQAENFRRERDKERPRTKSIKKTKHVAVGVTQANSRPEEANTMKLKQVSSKKQPTKAELLKRIIPTSMPSLQPEDQSSTKSMNDPREFDSPPPELPDDGLLDMLSLDKTSDSDENEPSMVSLILPVSQEKPMQVLPSPVMKKTLTGQKRFKRPSGGPPMEFNFTNAEARRQAKIKESAAQVESDEVEIEPEPMPNPVIKKRLKRRKDQNTSKAATLVEKNLALGRSTAVSIVSNKTITQAINARKSHGEIVGNQQPQAETENPGAERRAERSVKTTTQVLKRVKGKSEPMSIKQRLANAELLSRMNKMHDVCTPKVLNKKMKKAQKEELSETGTAKQADVRKMSTSDSAESLVSRQIEDGDLSISLNSSGLISDDSPNNIIAASRMRLRGGAESDVTPTKKLQFQEITKRLVKSPMPRFLRTPTPLMSPVAASGHAKQKALSPGPQSTSIRSTVNTRRLNSAPVQLRKASNANRFGIPVGVSLGANTSAFSMFDAFVNSGSSASIPKLKSKTRDVSPSV
ncbi:uncharacterized protein CCR75_000216 [Bremia lactucae]|uniref:Uncharacterized protein n=1 Tax=Bremia lactucae TaxID=4779 RepID=A0A976FDY7_BRELC|nr:hypothetical protein CCR75_000216 [Bremia lactucae]